MGDAIKYLYQNFILRDVLSFVTPGAIIVIPATYMLYPDIFDRYIPWPFYVPLFGLFFTVGFATQCFGEFVGFVRIHLLAKSSLSQRLSLFGLKWDEKQNTEYKNVWWKDAYSQLNKFYETTRGETGHNERERLQHERIIVLRQMCSNNFLAIFVSSIFVFIPSTLAKLSVAVIV